MWPHDGVAPREDFTEPGSIRCGSNFKVRDRLQWRELGTLYVEDTTLEIMRMQPAATWVDSKTKLYGPLGSATVQGALASAAQRSPAPLVVFVLYNCTWSVWPASNPAYRGPRRHYSTKVDPLQTPCAWLLLRSTESRLRGGGLRGEAELRHHARG